jgi:4-amino-4-deoxy-L-arabinose transferase-like glycosyltransferase
VSSPPPAPLAAPTSALARAFDAAAKRPLWVFVLLVAIQALPAPGNRGFWAFDEVRHADALRGLLHGRHAVVLYVNDQPYPDKPPLYFWFVAAISRVVGDEGTLPWFLASAISGVAFLAAVVSLAKAAGASARAAFAAALMTGASPLFVLLARTTRMDLAFGAAIVAAMAALLRGWSRDERNGSTVLAFAWMAVATWIKGPLGTLFPVAGGVAWLVWRGRLRRACAADSWIGAAVVVAAVGGWAAAVAAAEGGDYLRRVLDEQVLHRAVNARHHVEPFWFYAACLPVVAMPWTGAFVALPFARVRAASAAALASRKTDAPGVSFLACTFVAGFVLLSLASTKFFVYLLPLLPALSILATLALERAEARAARVAWIGVAVVTLLLGVAVPFLDRVDPWDADVQGLLPVGASLLVLATAVFAVRRAGGGAPALVVTAGSAVAALLTSLLVVPSLDPMFCPRAQAEAIVARAKEGYVPLVYRVYPGTYSWYAGRALPETDDLDVVEATLRKEPRVAIATSRRQTLKRPELFRGLRVVHEQWIEVERFVVLVKD